MKTSTESGLRKIVADEGCYLTQSDENVVLIDRILASVVVLAKSEDFSDYKEIGAQEADGIRTAQEAEFERLREESEKELMEAQNAELERHLAE